MSATPRDLLKTRRARVGEVYSENALGSGQANSQLVSFGCGLVVGSTVTAVGITAGEVVLGQAATAIAANVVGSAIGTTAVTTAAGQFRKVLVEVNAAGALTFTPGAVATTVQADAVLPKGDPTKISLGWIEIPASFTAGTDTVTTGMLKNMPYSNPATP